MATMEPLRGDGVSGLTVAVVRVAVEIIPNDGDFGSWLMPTEKGGDWESINDQYCIQIREATRQKIKKMSHEELRIKEIRKETSADRNMRTEEGRIARFLGHRDSQGRVWCRVSVCDSLSGWGLVVLGAEGLWLYASGSEVRGYEGRSPLPC